MFTTSFTSFFKSDGKCPLVMLTCKFLWIISRPRPFLQLCIPVVFPVSTRIQDEDIKPLARYLMQYLLQGYPQKGELLLYGIVFVSSFVFEKKKTETILSFTS
ncbi:hypothetical protein ACFFRR_010416 [Megaselia abdita]